MQPEAEPGTVTRLLEDVANGDRRAMDALFPIVYDELRRLAHRHRRHWNGDSTLGTTALVHEAYLKLVGADRLGARTSAHFLHVAAVAMRHILCNYARDRKAAKRGGESVMVSMDAVGDDAFNPGLSDSQAETLSALGDALQRLERVDPRLSHVVECRFFAGLTVEETASALQCSPATVKRDWALARAWLFREMRSGLTS
jgi:RNA polymerase sigma factor (TIGR02999 family)